MIRFLILILAATLSLLRAEAVEPSLKVIPLENDVICVRVSHVTADFARELQGSLTNKVTGLVLDLRFADGEKGVEVKNVPLPGRKPVVVLVNSQTAGAAAELATTLRAEHRAILIGATNAGIKPDITLTVTNEQDRVFQDNPYATAEKPAAATGNRDLLPFVDHTSEAELVRRRTKDGDDDAAISPRSQPEKPVIRDPALARAVDLLTALAILKPVRG